MVFGKKQQIDNLNDLYSQQLLEQYSVEDEYLKLLRELSDAASLQNLQQLLVQECAQTEDQRDAIERICKRRNLDPSGHSSKAMKGLTKSASEAIDVDGEPAVRDMVIVTLLRRIKHFEGSGFETLRTYAEQLGYDEDADDHQSMAERESEAAQRLAEVGNNNILKGLKRFD